MKASGFPLTFIPLFVALAHAPLFAENSKEGPKTEATSAPSAAESDSNKLSVTEHSAVIAGSALQYKATAEYLILKDETEKGANKDDKGKAAEPIKDGLEPKAKVFYMAYTAAPANQPNRPVTFVFNGGPGAASVWLHLGALGPRRVKLNPEGDGTRAPYELIDNEFSCLDQTDLVFIDPVSTGYSRPAAGETSKSFHGFGEDIQSVAEFIRLYTTTNKRWLSPKFLIGESYGGTRAAALVGVLQDRFDLFVNGVVIIGGVFNWQTLDFRSGNDLPYTLFLPSYTAAAWYHKRLGESLQKLTLEQARKEAETFASGDYLLALAQGNKLADAERKKIANRLAALTALPEDTILRYDLRVPSGEFRDELLKSKSRSIGRFDSRITGIQTDPDGSDFDPSFASMRGNFNAAINDYARRDLKFETELPYRTLANVGPWNFSQFENRYLEVGDSLRRSLSKDPHLKVWVIGGFYDLAVSYFGTDYALRQMNLDPAIAPNIHATNYEGGHMFYTQEAPLKQFKADLVNFMSNTLK